MKAVVIHQVGPGMFAQVGAAIEAKTVKGLERKARKLFRDLNMPYEAAIIITEKDVFGFQVQFQAVPTVLPHNTVTLKKGIK
jgi:hypothetical protein